MAREDLDVRISPRLTTRQMAARISTLEGRIEDLEKFAGRIEALECRVGVAPRMPPRDALGNRNVQAGVHTIGPRGLGPTTGY